MTMRNKIEKGATFHPENKALWPIKLWLNYGSNQVESVFGTEYLIKGAVLPSIWSINKPCVGGINGILTLIN